MPLKWLLIKKFSELKSTLKTELFFEVIVKYIMLFFQWINNFLHYLLVDTNFIQKAGSTLLRQNYSISGCKHLIVEKRSESIIQRFYLPYEVAIPQKFLVTNHVFLI